MSSKSRGIKKLIFNLKLCSIVDEEIQDGVTKPEHREERFQELQRFYARKKEKEKAMIIEFKQLKRAKGDQAIGEWQKKYGSVC